MSLFVTIILDGVGIGAQADAHDFGDVGADTLGHVCETSRPQLRNLARWGLGRIRTLAGIPAVASPAADFGRMCEVSAGKDSTTGHWELAGVQVERPFPTYANGFPDDLLRVFMEETGCEGILGNEAASGTEIIQRLGKQHQLTGSPIVYTSADSVFQVAAHVDVLPLPRLYEICQVTRHRVCTGAHAVGRVIARPFQGSEGAYTRLSPDRKDYALKPFRPPIQSRLQDAGVRTISVGKVGDLFDRTGFDECIKTKSNHEGIEETLRAIQASYGSQHPTFIWTNLVDFDQEFGHRNDIQGFADALEHFDSHLPRFELALQPGSVIALTADHGNDPAFPGTDHTREYVPLMVRHDRSGRDLGLRSTLSDHAASVAQYFGIGNEWAGTSFLPGDTPPL